MRLIAPIMSVVLALALAGAIWLLYGERAKSSEQAEQIAKLKANLADKSVQQAFDLRRKCAADAGRFYKQWNSQPGAHDFYESHYNRTRQACFILTYEGDPASHYEELRLFDAVEGRKYADFSSMDPFGAVVCQLTPVAGGGKGCKSQAEFDAFVASYMESDSDSP